MYTAIVLKKVKHAIPVLNGKGQEIFLDAMGKEVPRDEHGALTPYAGPGTKKMELLESDSIDNPLTDDAGNVVQAGTEEALLRRVREHFEGQENVEILRVVIQKTEKVREVSAAELAAVK